MDSKLSKKLIFSFPLLYAECINPADSLMKFGFEIEDGWFDLIWQLSLMLEPIVQEYVKHDHNPRCARCKCSKRKHYGYLTKKPGKCLALHIDTDSKEKPPGNYWSCYCENYQSSHPRLSRIEIKFNGLKFHMTYKDQQIFDLISKAEKLSSYICQRCGNASDPQLQIRNLCPPCNVA